MKHVIIGTAGHVDHGKTALVKALTGIDTDRLEEEKRRGVTIEPGFAYLDFDDGSRAGLIDVPGHERFIRNMLAGAGGVDLAMLVIAADEGVMPQTREHLGILTQLGIGDGLVVITKLDKVEPDWLELVIDDISQLVSDTFLDGKQFISVSSVTGEGIPELKKALRVMLDTAKEKDSKIPFRLPVDRVFPVDGFGIVVTGTLIEGSVRLGDIAEILPSGEKAPVRNIQVHGDNTDVAYAGQRTAISLAGVKRGNITRGDVIASEGTLNTSSVIDVKLSVLKDSERTIKNGSELHLYHGARTELAKVFLLESGELQSGDSNYARFKLKEPLPCKRGDRFVVRFFSPIETIGGGIILDSLPQNRISRNESAINALKIREQGSIEEIVELTANEYRGVLTELDLCRRADIDITKCKETVETLLTKGCLIKLMQDRYISKKVIEAYGKESKGLLAEYHRTYPLRGGMNIAELRQKLLPEIGLSEANAVLKELSDRNSINLLGKVASLPDFSVSYSTAQENIRERLLTKLIASGYDVDTPEEIAALFSKNEKRDFEQVLESMTASGEIIVISPQIYWHKDVYEKAVGLIHEHFKKEEEITLAQCRDLLGTSRKYALALLEHLDGKKVTKMQGDARRLIP